MGEDYEADRKNLIKCGFSYTIIETGHKVFKESKA